MRLNRWKVQELMARKQIATQLELAQKVGVDPATLSAWMRGENFTIASLSSLCQVLGATPNDLLTNADAKKGEALAAARVAVPA